MAATMPVLLLVALEVKDYKGWRARYDGNRAMRAHAGLTERFVGRDAKKPNMVHLGLVAPSMEVASHFLASAALLDAMASAGVTDAPDIRFVLLD